MKHLRDSSESALVWPISDCQFILAAPRRLLFRFTIGRFQSEEVLYFEWDVLDLQHCSVC